LQEPLLQQDEPDWQQLEVQHEPVQHFAPGLQQESLVMAKAESEARVRTTTANIFFMEISFRCEWVERLRRGAESSEPGHRNV